MNEEVNAVLQVYQNKLNGLLAQNIALEAKVITLTKKVEELTPQPSVDGGEAVSYTHLTLPTTPYV